MELRLRAPLWFDENSGYWTGEADAAHLERALAAVPPDPAVEREARDGEVVLRGPEAEVLAHAERLRKAGLE